MAVFNATFQTSSNIHVCFDTDPVLSAMFGIEYEQEKYEGSYTVTPSAETQTLNTQGLVMTGDVVVEAIPSNYGLITWNGSYLTVS